MSQWRIKEFRMKDNATERFVMFGFHTVISLVSQLSPQSNSVYVYIVQCSFWCQWIGVSIPYLQVAATNVIKLRVCLSHLFWGKCSEGPETTAKRANTSSPHGTRLHIGKIVWCWPLINLSFHSTLSAALWNQSNKLLSAYTLCCLHMNGRHTSSVCADKL